MVLKAALEINIWCIAHKTEYGIAYLFGKNIRQRAYYLIKIAHPDHRERLEKEAFDRMKCMPSKNLIRLGSLIDFSLELSLKFAILISSAH
jgi:acyl-CoA hydrolase